MNKLSFLDELLELCSFVPIVKQAYANEEVNTIDIPAGMMSSDPTPPQLAVIPDDVTTRIKGTAARSLIQPGALGSVTEAAIPIDYKRFNRVYETGSNR